jgi:hypothetical protein
MSDSEKPKSSWWEIITNCCVSIDRKCKPTEHRFEQCAILNILGHAGRPVAIASIIVAMFVYVMGGDERRIEAENQRKAKHYQAWQVISAAQGKPGSGGRMDALQDLHRDGISLAGVDISKANLPKLNLEKADLSEANLSNAILGNANLSGANFRQAVLSDADFHKADLSGADLSFANLVKAHLWHADLSGAILYYANLADAGLVSANLTGANLWGADIGKITGWQSIKSIEFANICGVKGLPEGFIEWATEHGAVSIADPNEWKRLVREKRQEKPQHK